MKILLVDDSSTMRRIQKNTLGQLGFTEVDEAEDGAEAVKKIQAGGGYQLVLLDWNMPNMNGLEVIKTLRADATYKALPIVMVTSESEKSKILEAVQAGASNYIVKPFSSDVLKDKLTAMGLLK